jgi:dihydroorotate dehydrogenase
VVNVSSPNTPGLRDLQDNASLTAILNALQDYNHSQAKTKPILLKMAPDLDDAQIDNLVTVTQQTKIQGIVATNTTVGREGLSYSPQEIEQFGNGGLSGSPLTQRSTEVIARIKSAIESGKKENKPELAIIGSGGVMTASDAIDKFKAGADLVQLYTGFIYEGPQLISDIKKQLLKS